MEICKIHYINGDIGTVYDIGHGAMFHSDNYGHWTCNNAAALLEVFAFVKQHPVAVEPALPLGQHRYDELIAAALTLV